MVEFSRKNSVEIRPKTISPSYKCTRCHNKTKDFTRNATKLVHKQNLPQLTLTLQFEGEVRPTNSQVLGSMSKEVQLK